jgi:putative transposase
MEHEYYRRHLPHWQPSGEVFFVTFRLKDSLPYSILDALRKERERDKLVLETIPEVERAENDYLIERRSFGRWDVWLDKAQSGPRWLSQPEIAGIVKDAFFHRDGNELDLYAFCIMSNHVHAVFEPLLVSRIANPTYTSLEKIMQSLKRHTARQANLILGRQGAFWQAESYDHVVRDAGEFERIVGYVLKNPVKAGLVDQWQDWPWSYYKW